MENCKPTVNKIVDLKKIGISKKIPFMCIGLAFAFAALPHVETANAATINATIEIFDGSITGNPLDDLTITFTGLDSNATSGATVTFTVIGDFDSSLEFIDLSVDGFSFGRWLDSNTGNDIITGPAADAGNQYSSTLTGTALIPLASLGPLLSDGALAFLFEYSSIVNNLFVGDFAKVQIQYEASAVPEPATLTLFGLGLLGLGVARRRRTRRAA